MIFFLFKDLESKRLRDDFFEDLNGVKNIRRIKSFQTPQNPFYVTSTLSIGFEVTHTRICFSITRLGFTTSKLPAPRAFSDDEAIRTENLPPNQKPLHCGSVVTIAAEIEPVLRLNVNKLRNSRLEHAEHQLTGFCSYS